MKLAGNFFLAHFFIIVRARMLFVFPFVSFISLCLTPLLMFIKRDSISKVGI